MRWVFAVLVVVVLVGLVGIVRRVADDDGNLALVLALHALDIFLRKPREHVVLVAGLDTQPGHIVQRVDEAEIRETPRTGPRSPHRSPRCSGSRRSRAGSPLRWRAARSCICAPASRGWPRKCSRNSQMKVPVPVAGSRISTCSSISCLPKCFWREPVGALDHELHDLIRRIDDAQPVGGLRIIDLVKILVDQPSGTAAFPRWLEISAALARIAA